MLRQQVQQHLTPPQSYADANQRKHRKEETPLRLGVGQVVIDNTPTTKQDEQCDEQRVRIPSPAPRKQEAPYPSEENEKIERKNRRRERYIHPAETGDKRDAGREPKRFQEVTRE